MNRRLIRLLPLGLIALTTLSLWANPMATPPGDRHPHHAVVYPAGAFYHNGGRIINVTKPPFNARGDGKTDDTAALIQAYDFVAEQSRVANAHVQAGRKPNGQPASTSPFTDSYILYFPAGEYLVSDTILYTGAPIIWKSFPSAPVPELDGLNKVRFIGENRERTIIRLRDRSPGFGAGKQKPVISFSKIRFNNTETMNVVSHLTIDTGSGNPGAIGVDHAGANLSTLRDLTIRSGDGDGVAGIAILTSPTMGYHCDITIEGFRTGIWMVPYHVTHNSFEYVTLRGQTEAAIALDDSTTSLRKILVANAGGPAVWLRGSGSLASVTECSFTARPGVKATVAISAPKGSIFARNISNAGYAHALAVPEKTLPAGLIEEFSSPASFTLPQGKEARSLNLPVEDEPEIPYPTQAGDWALVDDYIAAANLDPAGDVSSAVQAALNSGKAHILFGKQQKYRIEKPVTVPAAVVRVNGLFANFQGTKNPVFIIKEDATAPLVFENFDFENTAPMLRHEAPRTLWLSSLRGPASFYKNTNGKIRTRLFLTNVAGFGKSEAAINHQDVWARWINTESPTATNFDMVDSTMWVFGYKTEKHRTSFSARQGSKLEVFGGVTNQYSQLRLPGFSPFPAYLVEDSRAYIFACLNGPDSKAELGYKILLTAQLGEQRYDYDRNDAPARPGRAGQYFLMFSVNPPGAENK